MSVDQASQFKERTISGIGWSVVSQLGTQSMQLIIGVTLARLLTPNDFGLIGMILVFTGFANIFTDLGFGSAIIQKKDVSQEHYSSVFWLNIGTGFVLMMVFIGLSPLIGKFYGESVLVPLTMVTSSNFLIGSFGIVQTSILKKDIDFKKIALINMTALLISGIAGISMAFMGLGVWSLVWQSILLSFIQVIILWFVTAWRPSLSFNKKAVKELIPFSINLLGFTSINYWLRNGDNLLIGKVLGDGALGIYSKAYSIMLLPLRTVSSTISRVMFPAFSSIQEDRQRIARAYLTITRTIALITFPMMIGLWVVSEDFVLLIFGDQWADMIPLLQVFCFVGLVQSIGTLNGNLYLSQGRTDLQFKVGTIIGILGIGAIVIGLNWGIRGVAYAYGAFSLLAVYPSIAIAVALIDLKFLVVAKNLAAITLCSLGMGIAVWSVGLLLPVSWPHWANLGIQIPFGIFIFWSLISIFKIEAYLGLKIYFMEEYNKIRNQN